MMTQTLPDPEEQARLNVLVRWGSPHHQQPDCSRREYEMMLADWYLDQGLTAEAAIIAGHTTWVLVWTEGYGLEIEEYQTALHHGNQRVSYHGGPGYWIV